MPLLVFYYNIVFGIALIAVAISTPSSCHLSPIHPSYQGKMKMKKISLPFGKASTLVY